MKSRYRNPQVGLPESKRTGVAWGSPSSTYDMRRPLTVIECCVCGKIRASQSGFLDSMQSDLFIGCTSLGGLVKWSSRTTRSDDTPRLGYLPRTEFELTTWKPQHGALLDEFSRHRDFSIEIDSQSIQCRPEPSKYVLIGGSVNCLGGTTFRVGTRTKRPTRELTP